jgi:flagellar biosynthesis protein
MTPNKSSPQRAVALAYGAGENAPKVSAKGYGPIAEEIIRRAREAGVYVHESRELVQLLMQVDLDAHIPPKLYRAVAILLAWVYRVERNSPSQRPQLPDLSSLIESQEHK